MKEAIKKNSPLAHAHHESVDILVQRVKKSDGLDDHVVDAVDVELDFCARVGVRQSEPCPRRVGVVEALEQPRGVDAHAAEELRGELVGGELDPRGLAQRRAQLRVRDADLVRRRARFLLLVLGVSSASRSGQGRLEEGDELRRCGCLGEGVGLGEGVRGRGEGPERDELDDLRLFLLMRKEEEEVRMKKTTTALRRLA